MFSKSPFSRFAEGDSEEKKSAKKPSEVSKRDDHPQDKDRDDIAKSVTVHQHHDGHYSTDNHDTGESRDHDSLEDAKDHLGKEFEGEEDSPEDEQMSGGMKGMY